MSYFAHPDLRTIVLEVVELRLGASDHPSVQKIVRDQLQMGLCALIKATDRRSPTLVLGRGVHVPAAALPSLWREKVPIVREREFT
jgi:hypothetical protein